MAFLNHRHHTKSNGCSSEFPIDIKDLSVILDAFPKVSPRIINDKMVFRN